MAILFKALPSDTPDDILLNEAIPSFRQLVGSTELAEHLGEAVRGKHNGSINAHITMNAMMMGGEYQLDEVGARQIIEGWYKETNFADHPNDQELGMKFLTEIIAKIVD